MVLSSTSVTTIDQQIADWFNSLETSSGWSYGNMILCCIAILLTVLLCSFIGFEREKRGRSAGLRTHLLVGVGSCIVMIISIYGFPSYAGSRDVARLAAGVITGVGFLGAGAIIHANGGIKGLTTASTIWLVMAIGLACGSMNFVLAIFSCAVVMLVLIGFRPLERRITKKHPTIVVTTEMNCPIMSILLEAAKETECTVNGIVTQLAGENTVQVTFNLSNESGDELRVENFVRFVKEKSQVKNIEILNNHKK